MNALAKVLAVGVAAFTVLQCLRPSLPNPPVTGDLDVPAPVKQILRASCYQCHSNETRLPWFDRIVPAYWIAASDVKKGRAHLNFSESDKLSPAQRKGFLFESVSQIQLGAMPPRAYTLIHPSSVVTPEQLRVLRDFLRPPASATAEAADPAREAAAQAQRDAWIAAPPEGKPVPAPAPNGLAFFPDYKDWKPVSTTERFDNGTLRVILGNPVAIAAIRENRIAPWPDGAAFAKIAWDQLPDGQGAVAAGEFKQVEFMVKDAKKHAATAGWGFGRWRGTDLAPYGKSPDFAMECVSCHAPMQGNDFVFTTPIHDAGVSSDLWNQIAALPEGLPSDPLAWRVIASSLDREKAAMATLYGNDLAVAHARTSPQTPYPPGAILCRVTWGREEDRHWFGANIPGQVRLVEYVLFGPGAPAYEAYRPGEGLDASAPLRKLSEAEAIDPAARIAAIVDEKPSVMP